MKTIPLDIFEKETKGAVDHHIERNKPQDIMKVIEVAEQTLKSGDKDINGALKVDRYNWKKLDMPGVFLEIPKSDLNIDHEYQRNRVLNQKVCEFARDWQWSKCGCLLVAQRDDQSYWVFDGQHRKLAADKRSDIKTLPCLVFEMSTIYQEARSFVGVNTLQSKMGLFDKFKAELYYKDPRAIAVNSQVQANGYEIKNGNQKNTICCVSSLYNAYTSCPVTFAKALNICCQIASGESFHGMLFDGVFYLERWMSENKCGSLLDRHNIDTLKQAGISVIDKSIGSARAYYINGGPKIFAEGVVNVINHKRSSRRINYSANRE